MKKYQYLFNLIDNRINWNKTLFRLLIYACVMSWYIVPLYSSSYPRSNYIDRHRFTVTVLFIFELSSPFVVWPCVCDLNLLLDSSVFDAIFLASMLLHLCSQWSLSPSPRGYSQKEGSQLKTSSSHLYVHSVSID